jgi:dCMP deaminase
VSEYPILDDVFYLRHAAIVALRSTCDRAAVGCVIVHPLAGMVGWGYNRSPAGSRTCDGAGHLMHDDHCCRATHAEIVALAEASTRGRLTIGATAYITHAPCISCAHALIAHGIARIVYADAYRLNDATRYVIEAAGVALEQWSATDGRE